MSSLNQWQRCTKPRDFVMAGLRVRLQLLDDCMVNRKYWFFIDTDKNKTIQDVVEKINNRYSTCCERLCLKDAELHFAEDIAILRDEDLIEVHCKQVDQGTVSHYNGVPQVHEVEEEITQKPKKKKKKKDRELPREIETVPECITSYKKIENDKNLMVTPAETIITETYKEAPAVVESVITSPGDSDDLMTPEAKSTRKRRRKRKSKKSKESEPQDNFQEYFVVPQIAVPESATRQHIRFDETYTNESFEASTPAVHKVAQPKEIFRESPIQSSRKSSAPKNSQPTGIVPQELSALMSLRSAVFSRKSAPREEKLDESKTEEPVAPQNVNEMSPDLDPTHFPPLKSAPRVGDIIAYKVLEMSENYTPEVSDYRKGRIIEAKPGGDVTIEIIGNPVINKHSRGKFELIDIEDADVEVEEIIPEVETIFIHHINELIEPRLIYP